MPQAVHRMLRHQTTGLIGPTTVTNWTNQIFHLFRVLEQITDILVVVPSYQLFQNAVNLLFSFTFINCINRLYMPR
jgi:hypothetical protein